MHSGYHMEDITNAYKILLENMKGRDNLGDNSIDKRIMLNLVFQKWGVGMWNYFICSCVIPMVGSCEHGNEFDVCMRVHH